MCICNKVINKFRTLNKTLLDRRFATLEQTKRILGKHKIFRVASLTLILIV